MGNRDTVQCLGKTQSPNGIVEPTPPEPGTRKENRNVTLRSPGRGSPRRAKESMPFKGRTGFPRALGWPCQQRAGEPALVLGGNAQDSESLAWLANH